MESSERRTGKERIGTSNRDEIMANIDMICIIGIILFLILILLFFLIIFIILFVFKLERAASDNSFHNKKGRKGLLFKDHFFEFNVGSREVHNICYHFNRFWGTTTVYLDGEVVKKGFRIFSFLDEPTGQNEIRFIVGDREVHEVYVKVESPVILPLFRPYYYHIFIDGERIKTIKF